MADQKYSMADQKYSIPQFRQKLAKHIRSMVIRAADDIQDLKKRELFKNQLLSQAHAEPGSHEALEPGVPDHMEPGDHERFAMNPPAGPDAATAAPIQGGLGVPPGQLESGAAGQDLCPLCHHPDVPGSCTCLDNMILGKNEVMGYGDSSPMAMSEPLCKECGKAHGVEKCMGKGEANPGANKDPSKAQPTKPVANSCLPPEKGGESCKSQDDNKPKKNNPLKKQGIAESMPPPPPAAGGMVKGAVPEAKPPSGKVPGATSAPPMASNTSKPGVTKTDDLDKSALPASPKAQIQQHALMAGSKQAAATAAPSAAAPKPPLTNPNNMGRANAFQAAAAGAFQPKGPVHSGLELAGKPKLTPPPAGVREVKPAAKPMAAPGKSPFGSMFGKNEKCALCGREEHPGECP